MIAPRPSSTIISRKARFWPKISHEIVTLPAPPNDPGGASVLSIFTMLLSIAGLAVSGFIFSRMGGGSSLFFIGFIAMGAFAALGSLVTFIIQSITARRQRRYLLSLYKQKLLDVEQKLRLLHIAERQARIELDPPFVPPMAPTNVYDNLHITALVQHAINEQDVELWARHPEHPDFLTARIGMGSRPATYQISGEQNRDRIALPTLFDQYEEYSSSLRAKYSSLVAPLTISLNEYGPIAIMSAPSGAVLSQGRELARAIVSNIAYHHSPEDVRILILAPESQANEWNWATLLPHTHVFDIGSTGITTGTTPSNSLSAVALGPEAIVELLPLLSRELGRRELLLGDEYHSSKDTPPLPHLLIVVDYFDPTHDLDPPPLAVPLMKFKQSKVQVGNRLRLTTQPLKRPEMLLALSRGSSLGVSVLCVCSNKVDAPVPCGVAIDMDIASYSSLPCTQLIDLPDLETPVKKQKRDKDMHAQHSNMPSVVRPQACIRLLQPDPPSFQICDLVDRAPLDALRYFATKMQSLQPAIAKRVQLRTQVDLRTLFEPVLDVASYDPRTLWADPAYRTSVNGANNGQKAGTTPLLRIPIGQKIGDEVQYLDLIKDGPHGLLIGQTGSGKSELLQTIIMSLALLYRPAEATFLLIDYKAGLALEPFRHLPHTISFLSNVSSPALIQRFITMLRAEAGRREKQLKDGKPMPRLVIVIDEFAEMAKRTETILDELFTITRVGREIGMHLLLSAQRPEGIIGTKVRDYVQYRLCLRCASPDDSREVLGRVDAASLPASIPGRGYLLHGDNQLDLFQAARTTLSVPL